MTLREEASLTRRNLLRAAAATTMAAGLAACSDGSTGSAGGNVRRSPDGGPPVPSVADFGAVGDGRTDDTAALQRALAQLSSGGVLRLDDGRTYLHSTVLKIAAKGTRLSGRGTLLATDEEHSSLQIEADDVTVEDVTLGVRNTTKRWDAPDQHRLYVARGSGVRLRGVTVTGSAASGIFVAGHSGFEVMDVMVRDTRADGIHLTQGSRDGMLLRPRTSNTGDDGVAVVSYGQDGAPCRGIRIMQPRVERSQARGISVVGGTDISYRDIDVRGSRAAGVYVACEGAPYFTADVSAISVQGGTVRGANTDASIDHGSVLVFAGRKGGTVRDVTVTDLSIDDSRSTASWQVGVVASGGSVAALRFDSLHLQRESPRPFATTSPGCCDTRGWTVAGRKVSVA